MISGRGAEDEYDGTTGVTTHVEDAIGGELQLIVIKAGLKGNF